MKATIISSAQTTDGMDQLERSSYGYHETMKIAYVTSFYPPDRTAGAELGTQFMAQYMAKQGHEVHVIITRANSGHPPIETQSGVNIYWLRPFPLPILRSISEWAMAIHVVFKIRADVVQGNCLLPGGAVAAVVSKISTAKSIVLCYGYDVCDMRGILAWLGRNALRHVHRVLTATEFCQNVVREQVPNVNTQVFYAGCDENVFKPLPQNKSTQLKQLLFIGRMIPEKGLDFLLEIMAILPKNYQLNIIGGQAPARVETLVRSLHLQERVQFLGFVKNHDLPQYFSKSDVMVLPSYREPFGVVCIESILCGTPVVCSDVMGLPEAVSHEKNGLVVNGRSHKVWAAAIVRAAEDQDLRERCASHALTMREKWSWSTRLKELEGHYRELIALV